MRGEVFGEKVASNGGVAGREFSEFMSQHVVPLVEKTPLEWMRFVEVGALVRKKKTAVINFVAHRKVETLHEDHVLQNQVQPHGVANATV